jgi:Fic-DOC domain mobile mystery protein B
MTKGPFDEPDDASTPLTADEKKGLIPTYITTRGELNQAEQKNIFKAQRWAFQRRRDVLYESFMRALHKRMFREVWEWAGTFRTSPRNIGIEPCDIAPELRKLLDDVKVQIQYASYPPDEIASRFHYRLVAIRPFPNGNGRHGRLATDLLAVQFRQERFTWGRRDLVAVGADRARYIAAIRAADRLDFGPLLAFMRE